MASDYAAWVALDRLQKEQACTQAGRIIGYGEGCKAQLLADRERLTELGHADLAAKLCELDTTVPPKKEEHANE